MPERDAERPVRRRFGGWRPWHGKPRARDVLCAVAIAVSGVYAVATIPLTPALISSHPVLLELLTGSTSSIMSAGAYSDVDSKLQLALVIVAALPGIMRFDWVFWWAGRLWGHRIVERLGQHSPRTARLAGLAETRGRRWAGPLVALAAFLPSGASTAVYAAAGWTGLPLLTFVLWDTLGSAAWISVVAIGGYLLGSDGGHPGRLGLAVRHGDDLRAGGHVHRAAGLAFLAGVACREGRQGPDARIGGARAGGVRAWR